MKRKQMKIKLTDPMIQLEDERAVDKYRTSGRIVTEVLDTLIDMVKPKERVYNICVIGDRMIEEEIKKTKMNGGIAFPTSISINNVAGHNSPQSSDMDEIKKGDVVKIELGAHIEGYPAVIAYTVIVGDIKKGDRRAEVIKAVSEASREVARMMRPRTTSTEIMKTMQKYADKYNCKLPIINDDKHAPGVFTYQMSRWVIDGNNNEENEYVHRMILSRVNKNYEFTMREMELEEDEVYGIDIMMSTGTGRLRASDKETTIYKRLYGEKVNLKLQASRKALTTMRTRFPENKREELTGRMRMGLKECIDKLLVEPYPVIEEKEGEYVARVKFTVIVRNKPILISGRSADEQLKKLK